MGATSTFCAGGAEGDEELPACGAGPEADPAVPLLAGADSALVPKIALMIFPKILIALSH
jgi:hypothetical protein